tara:strand:+ start:1372 stop:1533 length:162 start_codon:yes stop_codon:yes gene_type:complete
MFMGMHLPYFGIKSNNQVVFSNYIEYYQRTIVADMPAGTENDWHHLTFRNSYS